MAQRGRPAWRHLARHPPMSAWGAWQPANHYAQILRLCAATVTAPLSCRKATLASQPHYLAASQTAAHPGRLTLQRHHDATQSPQEQISGHIRASGRRPGSTTSSSSSSSSSSRGGAGRGQEAAGSRGRSSSSGAGRGRARRGGSAGAQADAGGGGTAAGGEAGECDKGCASALCSGLSSSLDSNSCCPGRPVEAEHRAGCLREPSPPPPPPGHRRSCHHPWPADHPPLTAVRPPLLQIFDLESNYFQISNSMGNAVRGYEGFLGGSKKAAPPVQPEERLFSWSSVSGQLGGGGGGAAAAAAGGD